jgi:hypothetical protein
MYNLITLFKNSSKVCRQNTGAYRRHFCSQVRKRLVNRQSHQQSSVAAAFLVKIIKKIKDNIIFNNTKCRRYAARCVVVCLLTRRLRTWLQK